MPVIAVPKLISSAEFRDIDKEMGFGTLYKSLWGLQQRKVRQPHKRSFLIHAIEHVFLIGV